MSDHFSSLKPEYFEGAYRNDATLGTAESITVRLTFLSEQLFDVKVTTKAAKNVNKASSEIENIKPVSATEIENNDLPYYKHTAEIIPIDHCHDDNDLIVSEGEIPLELLNEHFRTLHLQESEDAFYFLTNSTRSFHRDITIPFASAGTLPMIVQCEEYGSEGRLKEGQISPHDVSIKIPKLFEMSWEGERRQYPFLDEDSDETAYEIQAKFVDTISFFESGYIAYSVSFVFRKNDNSRNLINAAEILLISLAAGSAGVVKGELLEFKFISRINDNENRTDHDVFTENRAGGFLNLNMFLKARLRYLSENAKEIVKIKSPNERKLRGENIFTMLSKSPNKELGVLLAEKILKMTFLTHSSINELSNTKASVSIEIIDAKNHDEFLRIARSANERSAQNDPITRRLAGLAQNVLDFDEQDESEIHDSLGSSFIFGTDVHLCSPNISVRFSESSRSYDDKWQVVGGEPYWFLVELIVAHNAKLLIDLNERVRLSQGRTGISQRLNHIMNISERNPNSALEKKAVKDRNSRQILFAHYIPNIFRYPIEKLLYENFTTARGIDLQYKNFEYFDRIVERVRRDAETHQSSVIDDRISQENGRLQTLLLIIGIIQSTGVFAAFAGIFIGISALDTTDMNVFGHSAVKILVFGRPLNALVRFFYGDMPTTTNDFVWALFPALGIIILSLIFLISSIAVFVKTSIRGKVFHLLMRTPSFPLVAALLSLFLTFLLFPILGLWLALILAVGAVPVLGSIWWHQRS